MFSDDRSWPNAAVELSITKHQGRKITDCHEGLESTQSGPCTTTLSSHPKFIVNLLPNPLIKD